MLFHPTTLILASVVALIVTLKNNFLFKMITITYPLIVGFLLFSNVEAGNIIINNISLTFTFEKYDKLIGFAFLVVLLASNLYSLGQNKKFEIILGSAYGAFCMMCLFASDFISMFIALELMMVISSMIIFIGGYRASLRYAKRYFLTHLISSNLIMIGISHIIIQSGNLQIVSATNLLNYPNYSAPMIYIMLIGILINIASFPFSGWMVNCYSKASPSGFLYLISFTTKISIVLMIKIFPGLENMQYFGIVMIIYASIRAMQEDNIFSLLCLLSIMAMGLMVIGISIGTEKAILATICYLFIHIIYKLLLSISVASLADNSTIFSCSDIKKIKNPMLLFSFTIAIAVMINVPLSSTFYIKYALSNIIRDDIINYGVIFLTFASLYILPWKKYLQSKHHVAIKINSYNKISLILTSSILLIIGFWGKDIPIFSELRSFKTLPLFSYVSVKQLSILAAALGLSYIFAFSRNNKKSFNAIEDISEIIMTLYIQKTDQKNLIQDAEEGYKIQDLEQQILKKMKKLHTQSTAIFIVFTFLTIMLLIFMITSKL